VRWWFVLLLAGCGRLGFEYRTGDGAAPGDDAPTVPITLVQQMIHEMDQVTTAQVSLPNDVTPGNVLLASMTCYNCGDVNALQTVSGAGASWTLVVGGPPTGVLGNEEVWLYVGTQPVAGAATITITATLNDWVIGLSEWSGLTGTVDVTNVQLENNMVSSMTSPALLTTHADDLLLVVESDYCGGGPTSPPDRGFQTLMSTMSTPTHTVAYRVVTATGSYATTWGICSTTPYAVIAGAIE
jgi:hypothetical protein